MIYVVNVADIETALLRLGGEATTRAIQDRVLADFCGGTVPLGNYKDKRTFRQTIQRKIEDHCPQAAGFARGGRDAKFIRVAHGVYRHAAGAGSLEFPAIAEVPEGAQYTEGSTRRILVDAYERNASARAKCIAHHGWKCTGCAFDFEATYGEIGRGFIHVHHVVPLSEIKATYKVDPIKGLVPLCANCHAIVHRCDPPLPVDELRRILGGRQKTGDD